MSETPIRVLVVDDTALYRKILKHVLSAIPRIEVVGTAHNGKIALEKIDELKPDIVTLDVQMPVMDGIEVLRQLEADKNPIGVIMLSALTTDGAVETLNALKLGAFDFVLKPSNGTAEHNANELTRTLEPMIKSCFHARHQRRRRITGALYNVDSPPRAKVDHVNRSTGRKRQAAEIVAIGISTGGPRALSEMLPQLTDDLEVPVVVVQHMPPIFTRSLADSLNQICAIPVCEVEDGQRLKPSHIYIAPGGKQMKVVSDNGLNVFRITDDARMSGCRPSVDYLFESLADLYGARTLAVIMTGMGHDGTESLRLLKQKSATIVAQDEASCVIYSMPRKPTEEGLVDIVVPLKIIADCIMSHVRRKTLTCK